MRTKLANSVLFLAIILAAMALGGSFYEGLAVYPAWSSSPPASLALIQEPGGIDPAPFWIMIHIALEITVIVALVLNWKSPRRRTLILLGLGVHVLMRVWTFLYFAPEITRFMTIPPDGPFSPELAARVDLWGALAWVRRVLIAIVSVVLLLATTTPFGKGERDVR